jgi:hypothetical protein
VLTGEASIASLFPYLSACRLVTIAQIEGRVKPVVFRLDSTPTMTTPPYLRFAIPRIARTTSLKDQLPGEREFLNSTPGVSRLL